MYYIAVDAMGGDLAPAEAVKGCAAALNERGGFGVVLVGHRDAIQRELNGAVLREDYLASGRLRICHASQVIENEDAPTQAIKEKKDSSMAVGLRLVKEEAAQAFVSAGNTGALLTGGLSVLGRVKGVLRPALGVPLPGLNSYGYTFLIDAGANVDAKPAYLAQFARMGSVYVENMFGVARPKVGLVNVGAEREKGNALSKETYGLLEGSGLNFSGNVEARDIPLGGVDVAVCDGFVGNILLKHSEGLSKALMSIIKKELNAEFVTKLGGALSKKAFGRIKKSFDAGEVGGAPFLGLTGLLVKAHGNSDERAFMNAIYQAARFIESGAGEQLRTSILSGNGQNDGA